MIVFLHGWAHDLLLKLPLPDAHHIVFVHKLALIRCYVAQLLLRVLLYVRDVLPHDLLLVVLILVVNLTLHLHALIQLVLVALPFHLLDHFL